MVGSGPNGLAAALTLAQAGHSVRVFEAASTPGGGMRSAELTLPGFTHDVCSAVHTALLASPFFRSLGLDLEMCHPEIPFAHPLGGDRAAALYRDVGATAAALGADGRAWSWFFTPLVEHADQLWPDLLGNLRRPPRHPISLARFGLPGLRSAESFARAHFDRDEAQALIAGASAHAMRRLDAPFTAAYGLVLTLMAHRFGWPVVAGGSERIVEAMVQRLTELGGTVACGSPITSLADLPPSRVRLFDVGPKQLADIAGDAMPSRYAKALRRFKYGPGVFKIDLAMSGPMPWTAGVCRRTGTVHVAGTMAEVSRSEADLESGRHSDEPYVLLVQPTVVDPSRAPAGQHTVWAYCHVPSGSTLDRTAAVEAQLDRFAPGFRDLVLARATKTAAQYETYDANYLGGDINAGRASAWQSFLGPVPRWSRYRTALAGTYLCSSSTAPGGGVHGMCGALAAQEAIRRDLH